MDVSKSLIQSFDLELGSINVQTIDMIRGFLLKDFGRTVYPREFTSKCRCHRFETSGNSKSVTSRFIVYRNDCRILTNKTVLYKVTVSTRNPIPFHT